MRNIASPLTLAPELTLGKKLSTRIPEADQRRQRAEVEHILKVLRKQPGVILADEVGMGKTFVALGVAYSVAVHSSPRPVVVMVPANLVDKWEQDLRSFCELYLKNRRPVRIGDLHHKDIPTEHVLRYGVVRHSVDFLKLLDDPPRRRSQIIFLAQGAMSRRQTDRWVRLAIIAEALRRHARGNASRLSKVKKTIHRYLAELIRAVGEQKATNLGEELWQILIHEEPATWKAIHNKSTRDPSKRWTDDPVPASVVSCLKKIPLDKLANALTNMPLKGRSGSWNVSVRIDKVRKALRGVEGDLWKQILVKAGWRSPLLVMDEAHHLKNSDTALARQLQSTDSSSDLSTGDGAFADKFDRMLFLTATPFQLGHHELVRVLERFGDVRWNKRELGELKQFQEKLGKLAHALTESQRHAMALQRSWRRLRPEDRGLEEGEIWWAQLSSAPRESLTVFQRAVVDAFHKARQCHQISMVALKPWIVRHNKGEQWVNTDIVRRRRLDGAALQDGLSNIGLPIPKNQLLPFFLAARSTVSARQDLLGEALSSSYEAFRLTRQNRAQEKDTEDNALGSMVELTHARWYLDEFDKALTRSSGAGHPKVSATVRKVVDLWEQGEKVLVFAFYRRTCRALRVHIGKEIERRLETSGRQRMIAAGLDGSKAAIDKTIKHIQDRFFDNPKSPGRRALDKELLKLKLSCAQMPGADQIGPAQWKDILDVMRRFLRVPSTLLRCFPLEKLDTIKPAEAVARLLAHVDGSGISWRDKFLSFIEFLVTSCTPEERQLYLDAGQMTQTGRIRTELDKDEDPTAKGTTTVANVQVATGTTKRSTRTRLMHAFNTPFFPDILVCSQVMGEGVDLQRFCRHVIHHDLDWNPSTIEQRTGRIDRLGCKAEGRHSIELYLPYLAGAADERQYRVMSEREQWFRVVMGQEAVNKMITQDSDSSMPLPMAISRELSFDLGLSLVES